jgi:hypothetical protein
MINGSFNRIDEDLLWYMKKNLRGGDDKEKLVTIFKG